MAETEDTAPTRSSTARRAANGGSTAARRSRSRAREDNLEAQINRLQTDLKAIGASIASITESKVNEAQSVAKNEARNLVRQGEKAVDEIQDEFGHMEKQIKDAIREKPLTAVAGAIAMGFVLALITR